MIEMGSYRALTPPEISMLKSRGCQASSWAEVRVSENFRVKQLWRASLEGEVYIGEGAEIINSTIRNYILSAGVRVEGVTQLECRARSRFGGGVEVATINECGGRAIKIYDSLGAQLAYVWATFRHREDFCRAVDTMVEDYVTSQESCLGYIGEGSKVIGVRFMREVKVGRGVTIEGASLLENGTIGDDSYVGIDVKARSFITSQGARLDTGATLERCFVGECAIVANGFTAIDSLIFANSHLENGEAASIFAAPYTVSHHKSSLLIAGLFSFFNAGSGSNQSNHLFKTGAVHQSIHPRGCKFASGAYIMAPAIEGAFTMVKGYHARHHDTLAFPFSYLIDDGGASVLMPGANLVSYGTYRDIRKWGERDRRVAKRDVINFEEHNPYITSMMVTAINTIHTLRDKDPDAEQYMWNRVVIKPSQMKRGEGLYNKAIVSSLGAMLSSGAQGSTSSLCGEGVWIDAAGQYITQRAVVGMISGVEEGQITTLEGIDKIFAEFGESYDAYAYNYAYWLLGELLGHEPSAEDIEGAKESARSSREGLERMIFSDQRRDCDVSMSVGYGLHASTKEEAEADFRIVRDL